MNPNISWLRSRLKIIYALFLDILILNFCFFIFNPDLVNKVFQVNFIIYYLFATLVWVFSSYLLGRYIFIEKKKNIYIFKKLFLNILCFSITLLSILGLSLVLNFNYIFLISGLIKIEFLIFANLILIIYQLIFYKILLKGRDIWIFWGDKKSFINLRNLIKREDINSEIIPKSKLKNKNIISQRNKKIGIIIENIDEISHKDYLALIEYREKGLFCMSLQDWTEKYLERIESNYLKGKFLILNGFYFPNNSLQFRAKRLGDLIISIILLIITFPIVMISGILIHLEDRGPILYSQLRTGFGGKNFRVFKLRSMKINAEKTGPEWSTKNDKRITKVGKIIRKFRFDELPQLICVIKGDMSLIGPRPERPEFDEELQKINHNYKYRYFMRPGLSGWAQVKYPYGASTLDAMNKLSYDLYYIRNFSNLLDLVILFKTIKLILGAKGSTAQEIK